jgi:hypothetical protein
VALLRTDDSEERTSSIIGVTRWRRYVTPKRRFLQEPRGLTSNKTAFFVVTAEETSNLTYLFKVYKTDVLTAVVVKGFIFCDKASRSPLKSFPDIYSVIF